MKTNLILVDMASAWSVNGVMRYLQELIDVMRADHTYQITWLRFVHQLSSGVIAEKRKGVQHLTIPLPDDMQSVFKNIEKKQVLWQKALDYLFINLHQKGHVILHLHTLNLMDFALYAQKRIPCKIIMHIHCIPWKGLYNNHAEQFNLLFEKYYIKKDYSNPSDYIFREYERNCYTQSDCIICVTECARDFILNTCPHNASNIYVIPNGIKCIAPPKRYKNVSDSFQCLFVGNSTRSKGLEYILKALEIVNMQYDVCLTIVGNHSSGTQMCIHSQHPFLDIKFTGKVNFLELKELYMQADIGIIGSLQEQCSYVAIEMLMFGLPIVTTDVDGLGEIFTNEKDALTVPVHYRPRNGLMVDYISMAASIIKLIESPKMRESLGRNARRTYREKYTAIRMGKLTKSIYNTMYNYV